MLVNGEHYRTVWLEDGPGADGGAAVPRVSMIEQRQLPHVFEIAHFDCCDATSVAIRDMVVRGAGAIGATAGFAMAQAVAATAAHGTTVLAREELEPAWDERAAHIESMRPTAQNLFFAVRTVRRAAREAARGVACARQAARAASAAATAAALAIADDDAACCRAIGEHGAALLPQGSRVSTHCNAGWLAFVDWGSALSPTFVAAEQGRAPFVWVDETRPRLQGANLTAWELGQQGIDHAVIADNASGHFMQRGEVDVVIVGSDRIAANGDVANKIGTYSSAVVARSLGIPFYVAAPTTTIDPHCPTGGDIPIEERDGDELHFTSGLAEEGGSVQQQRVRTTPLGSAARNPAFDVTPAELVTGIITEKGIVPATPEGIASVARLHYTIGSGSGAN